MKKQLTLFAILIICSSFSNAQVIINYTINTKSERAVISPYIYGICNGNYDKATFRRMGGNRLSAYNWENNFSNAGADYFNQNDTYLTWITDVLQDEVVIPAICLSNFHNKSIQQNAISAITLPMLGYVSNDALGEVSETELAPSARWAEVINNKGTAFTLSPELNDGKVFVDEEINYLINKFGYSDTPTGIKAYIMDNEPGLWASQFSRMRKDKVTYNELLDKSIDLSKTIKRMDANALVFGSEPYGFNEYWNLQEAIDADDYIEDYWFIDTYLKAFKAAHDFEGKRLLDVLTIHWYPDGGYVYSDSISEEIRSDRVQRPRSFWDSTYIEPNWIGQWYSDELPIIPRIKQSISAFYPDTKFAITEYGFGAAQDISGGIAQAEALGAFAKTGVDYASLWSKIEGYLITAFDLFLNYDNAGSKYGAINVKAESDNPAVSTIYASVDDEADSKLHFIVNNKYADSPITAVINLISDNAYDSIDVFYFDKNSQHINHNVLNPNAINGNLITVEIAAYTVCHYVLSNSGLSINNLPNYDWQFQITPNPAYCEISIKTNYDCNYYVELLDINSISIFKTFSESKINIENISSGAYFIRITNKSGKVLKTEKIIIE